MNLLKSLPVIGLLAALAVGVTFAHSDDAKNVLFYSNGFQGLLVGACKLNITKADGGQFVAWPPSETNTRFTTTWPTSAGEVELPVAKGNRGVDETLKVRFAKVGEKIEPVGYSWEAGREKKSCGGLELRSN